MSESNQVPLAVIKAFTPTGKLRASINLGNPILSSRDAQSALPKGVSVDLATAFAKLQVRVAIGNCTVPSFN